MEYTNLIKILNDIGNEITDNYKSELQKNKKIATGKLYNSIDYKIIKDDKSIKLIFIAEDYFLEVEEGRKAGGKMPPLNKIKEWMRTKGIIKRDPYIIARSISLKGIRSVPSLKKAREMNKYTNIIAKAIEADYAVLN